MKFWRDKSTAPTICSKNTSRKLTLFYADREENFF